MKYDILIFTQDKALIERERRREKEREGEREDEYRIFCSIIFPCVRNSALTENFLV